MPNGKRGDNPLSDLTIHGAHPFPKDIEEMLLKIDALGRRPGRWPLGENWPFSPREFHWEQGKDLQTARQLLTHLITMLESGRGDEVLIDPGTRRPRGSMSRSLETNEMGEFRATVPPGISRITVDSPGFKVAKTKSRSRYRWYYPVSQDRSIRTAGETRQLSKGTTLYRL